MVSKTRYKVARVFGSIKRWFRSAGARYIGLDKSHTQHVMEAIAYNLYNEFYGSLTAKTTKNSTTSLTKITITIYNNGLNLLHKTNYRDNRT
ncbi:protein of unknown function [Cardinium endosymbiont cEper1 of Encarsia pergandiella]|nr:protein of unknown function [Cardinium endosymbiont cEper1 of Encarsia pergandiella]